MEKIESDKSNILIIGGSGFVSGTLAQSAVGQGCHVWTLTRGQRPLPKGVIGLNADRRDPGNFQKAILSAKQSWDLVVDCIAYEPGDVQQDIGLFRSRAGHLVVIFSDFVFDPDARKFPQPEEAARYATSGYGGNKRLCELELVNADTGDMAWTVLRPCHIYGPGSQLGCLPLHGRDDKLIERLKMGEALRLVGGGHFLQQPIFAKDLAALILSLRGNARAHKQIFCSAGPDIIESREYYRIVARELGVDLRIEEVPVASHLSAHPEAAPFLCHRIYDLSKLRAAGLEVPRTPIQQGLREHAQSLMGMERES